MQKEENSKLKLEYARQIGALSIHISEITEALLIKFGIWPALPCRQL